MGERIEVARMACCLIRIVSTSRYSGVAELALSIQRSKLRNSRRSLLRSRRVRLGARFEHQARAPRRTLNSRRALLWSSRACSAFPGVVEAPFFPGEVQGKAGTFWRSVLYYEKMMAVTISFLENSIKRGRLASLSVNDIFTRLWAAYSFFGLQNG